MTMPTGPKELPHKDLEFSRSVAEGLAQRLASVDPPLSDPQRNLLLTIFSAAGDCVHSSGPSQPPQTNDDLKTQLFNAFVPDDGNDVYLIHAGARVGRVKPGTPIKPSPTPVPPAGPQPPAGPSVPPSSPPASAQS